MKHAMRIAFASIAASLLTICAHAQQRVPGQAPPPNVQVIEMTARKYRYDPSPIYVKRGTKVQLRIKALDHTHGFKIGVYPDGAAAQGSPGLVFATPQKCWKLEKGKENVIEFVAETPGTYVFRCCHFCGFGHRGMKGQLIVEP